MRANPLIYFIAAILFTTDIYVHTRKLNSAPGMQNEKINKPVSIPVFSTARYYGNYNKRSAKAKASVIPALYVDFSAALNKLDKAVLVPPENYSLCVDRSGEEIYPPFQLKAAIAEFAGYPGSELLTAQVIKWY